MKLLIITQKVDRDDPILGFFHRWLEEFSKNIEKLTVICLEKGEYDLPENVKVLSLGKEEGNFQFSPNKNQRFLTGQAIFNFQSIFNARIFKKVKYLFRFYKYIWKEKKNYDTVFVHMNPEYVILGWADWKILGKKIALWYTHKAVNLKLRLAEKLTDKIFTASPESFRLPSKKVEIVGHGIDTDKFKIQISKIKMTPNNPVLAGLTGQATQNAKLRIITAGRIAPVKNLESMIESAEILKNLGTDFVFEIAGGPITKQDKIYFEKLKSLVRQKNLENVVSFVGPIPYSKIQDFYAEGDIFVNLSKTGSVDKAVLEAMASGLSVITSNEAFKNILPAKYFLDDLSAKLLARKIQELSFEGRPNQELRDIVIKNHSLEELIKKIISRL